MKDVLNDRFEIIEIVLENRLYKAVDTVTGSFAAVKKWVNEDSFYEAEFEALNMLKHLNVPQIICAFEEDGCKYLAEEWLDGGNVDKTFFCRNKVDLAVAMAEFISEISSKVPLPRVHGDIKPSNMMMCNGKLYFVDFECSEVIDKKEKECIDRTVKVTGRFFTAPEVFYGKRSVQSDIYSIGAVMAWLFGGISQEGVDLSKVDADSKMKAIIKKCMRSRPEERYQDACELLSDLKSSGDICDVGDERAEDIDKRCSRSFSVYVDCNVFFAWEMAVTASSCFGMRVCVVALTERTQRKVNYYADSGSSYGLQNVEEDTAPYLFSTESLFKKDADLWLSKGLINNAAEHGEKMFYSGSRFPAEAQPSSEMFVEDLVKWGKSNFDCVVFVTDRYDDKPAVRNFTSGCDFTIATPLANIDDVEACKDYYERFGGNVLYAAWEFNPKTSLPEESISMIIGEEKYLGAIFHSDEKEYRRNFAGKIQPIFRTAGKEERAGYVKIINRLFKMMSGSVEEKERRFC